MRERLPPRLLLASASPRRAELLSLLSLPFEVHVSQVPEEPEAIVLGRNLGSLDAATMVQTLAEAKARDVLWRFGSPGCLVLGADTLVVAGGTDNSRALGKPRNAEEAREMLRTLSGTSHEVLTGVSLVHAAGSASEPEADTRVVRTRVRFRALSEEQIAAYVATGDSADKAGAYGIQSGAAPFVESVEGDYFNVVGLPVHTVALMLERLGVQWWQYQRARD